MSYRDINYKYILAALFFGSLKLFTNFNKLMIFIIQVIAATLASYWIIKEFGTIFHIEGGFSFIVVLQGLKLLECKGNNGKRDLFIFYNILFLVTCAQVIFIQSLFASMTSFISLFLIFLGINLCENNSFNLPKATHLFSKKTFKYIFISFSIVTLFFLFFPRFEIGFLRFNQKFSKSGFSPDAKPGVSDTLKLSDEVAFKIKFHGDYNKKTKIDKSQLYWVGSVLNKNNGYHWSPSSTKNLKSLSTQDNSKDNIRYTVLSETMTHKYLFSLDRAVEYPMINLPYRYVADKTFQLQRTYTQKIQYTFSSNLKPNLYFNKNVDYLYYPKTMDNLSLFKNLKAKFITSKKNERETIKKILNYFKESGFEYTLSPGRTNSLREFLIKKKGFCSHFASAFSILARMSGVPSRVVVGYHGGEYNEFDNILTVRQKDAHAWSEVYINGIGWQRVDPVAVVQPARITHGGQLFFDHQQDILNGTFSNIRTTWGRMIAAMEFVDNKWTQFMYSFNTEFQMRIARKLKLKLSHLYTISIFLPILLLIILVVINKYNNKKIVTKNKINEAYKKLCQKFATNGPIRNINEDPRLYMKRVCDRYPELKGPISDLFENYIEINYRRRPDEKIILEFIEKVDEFNL